MRTPDPAVFLMGPTASGKTAVAMELVRRLPLEVVSVDSAQIYRDMDIGTAKPDAGVLSACPHHLIDIITPEQSYSAARFREEALAVMQQITARGKVPLLAGGTMLYFKALEHGLSDLPPADPELRREIEEDARMRGWPALHADLARLDPQAAARLRPTDAQRIQRAMEICRLTGGPVAAAMSRRTAGALPYRVVPLALAPSDRSALHERIAGRFDAMMAAGLVDELAALRKKYRLDPALPSMRCVGYRQAWEYLEGRCDRAGLRDKGIAATRQLAKRQLTWMRAMDPPLLDCLRADLASCAYDFVARGLDRTH